MTVTTVLRQQAGIEYGGVKDQSESDPRDSLANVLFTGQFKRGRFDKPMKITAQNIRAVLGYERDNMEYTAIEDALKSGAPFVWVQRIGSAVNNQIQSYLNIIPDLRYGVEAPTASAIYIVWALIIDGVAEDVVIGNNNGRWNYIEQYITNIQDRIGISCEHKEVAGSAGEDSYLHFENLIKKDRKIDLIPNILPPENSMVFEGTPVTVASNGAISFTLKAVAGAQQPGEDPDPEPDPEPTPDPEPEPEPEPTPDPEPEPEPEPDMNAPNEIDLYLSIKDGSASDTINIKNANTGEILASMTGDRFALEYSGIRLYNDYSGAFLNVTMTPSSPYSGPIELLENSTISMGENGAFSFVLAPSGQFDNHLLLKNLPSYSDAVFEEQSSSKDLIVWNVNINGVSVADVDAQFIIGKNFGGYLKAVSHFKQSKFATVLNSFNPDQQQIAITSNKLSTISGNKNVGDLHIRNLKPTQTKLEIEIISTGDGISSRYDSIKTLNDYNSTFESIAETSNRLAYTVYLGAAPTPNMIACAGDYSYSNFAMNLLRMVDFDVLQITDLETGHKLVDFNASYMTESESFTLIQNFGGEKNIELIPTAPYVNKMTFPYSDNVSLGDDGRINITLSSSGTVNSSARIGEALQEYNDAMYRAGSTSSVQIFWQLVVNGESIGSPVNGSSGLIQLLGSASLNVEAQQAGRMAPLSDYLNAVVDNDILVFGGFDKSYYFSLINRINGAFSMINITNRYLRLEVRIKTLPTALSSGMVQLWNFGGNEPSKSYESNGEQAFVVCLNPVPILT